MAAVPTLRLATGIEEVTSLTGKILPVEKELAKISLNHPGVMLLRTITGVGIRTAEAFCAWVDDITRFGRNRQVGAYFRWVPSQDSSADRNRLGHITDDGPAIMRKLLSQASWMAVRLCPKGKTFFERTMGNKPERKKIALVAKFHKPYDSYPRKILAIAGNHESSPEESSYGMDQFLPTFLFRIAWLLF